MCIRDRRQTFSGTPSNQGEGYIDANVIPEIAIKSIEILKEGATSIYGSDAVSGVVNVITVQGRDFSKFDLYTSKTEHGGDNITQATFTTGGFFGNSSWTLGLNAEVRDPMYYADRDGFNSFTNDPGYGSSYVAPRAGLLFYTQASRGGANRYYGSEEFGYPCKNIDSDTMSKYSEIYKARKGLVVAEILDNSCEGCGAMVPPQSINEALAKNIVFCGNCSRFLYKSEN